MVAMTRIRHIAISNFRSLRSLSWHPSAGFNCLIGAGNAGKSTVLEAIDLCLGARRNMQFSDAAFHNLDIALPLTIAVTVGDLDESLKQFEAYGLFLRGYLADTATIEDEPEDGEHALTIMLKVTSDLEPTWALYSERAESQSQNRFLSWADRVRLAPTWIGDYAARVDRDDLDRHPRRSTAVRPRRRPRDVSPRRVRRARVQLDRAHERVARRCIESSLVHEPL